MLKLWGLCPLSNQAQGALGPQRAIKNRGLTACPKKENEISFALRPRPHLCLRPMGPKLTPLLCIQKLAIIKGHGSWPINSITSSTIANCVNRFICKKSSAFEQNTGHRLAL